MTEIGDDIGTSMVWLLTKILTELCRIEPNIDHLYWFLVIYIIDFIELFGGGGGN